MSEISAVGGDTSVQTETLVSEELTETQVKGLVEEAKTSIKQKNFDRASEIIMQLSQIHAQAQVAKGWMDTLRGYFSGSKCPVSISDLFNLFSDLSKANHEEGKKLIPILSKNFSIETDGYHYKVSGSGFSGSFNIPNKVSGSGFSGSFNIPIITDSEAKALIDHLYKLKNERKFKDLEKELPRLAQLCADRRVAMNDFSKLYINLLFANCTFAINCMPIFKEVYHMEVRGNRLMINSPKSGDRADCSSGVFSLLDCDSSLKRIAAEERPFERFKEYLHLARHQLDRAPEVMKKAEDALGRIDEPLVRASGRLSVMIYYQRNHDEKNFVRMASTLEQELSHAEESEKKHHLLAKVSVFRALVSLEKRDREGYSNSILAVAQEMKQVKDAKLLEGLQKDLEFLKSKREETFALDQLELHARKV
ncbi:MAG: hypothetical protein KFB93_00925 [Simkaniaceae bacterium]|nr:MAG: hypothetical protein KFB93_00925 [Simkaniaceae bacterium]